MKILSPIGLVCGFFVAAVAHAATIVNEGVLGNSGEQGPSLVRFAGEPATGLGVAYDRFGTLWDRAGKGTLNRYTLDGRFLAQHRLPRDVAHNDQIVIVGDTLVVMIRGRLYTMPITAPAGSEPKPLGRLPEISGMSFGVLDGQVALLNKQEIALVNVATGASKPVAKVSDAREVELGPDGAVYAIFGSNVRKFVNGIEITEGWPAQRPGSRAQLIGGIWYGQSYHTTIRRFSSAMEPQPGVVLGGASGSVIGHLDSNAELHYGVGLARIRENLFAVSSNTGVLHLLEWKDGPRQFEIVRRIGSVPFCSGLGLDDDGNIWCNGGSWRWADQPDGPLRLGVRAPEFPGPSQASMRKDGAMQVIGMTHGGKATLFAGKLNNEVTVSEVAGRMLVPAKDLTGAVIVTRNNRPALLTINAAGQAQALNVAGDNRASGDAVPVTLQFSPPVKACTTLALRDANTLLVAADGAVIELQPEGTSDWRETRRWNSWGAGPADKFGATIFIAADAGRLWAADRERHRVICFDLATGKPVASFGTPDQAGDTLATLNGPAALAARGERAVFYDSANQRVIKLRLRP